MENRVNYLNGKDWLKNAINFWTFDNFDEDEISNRIKSFAYKDRTGGGFYKLFNSEELKEVNNLDCSVQYLYSIDILNNVIRNILKSAYNSYHFVVLDDYIYDDKLISKLITDTLLDNGLEYRGNIVIRFSEENSVKPCLLFLNRSSIVKDFVDLNIEKYKIRVNKKEQYVIDSKSKMDKIGLSHPAPFSYIDIQKLCELKKISNKTILDPFMGVGSTIIACARDNNVIGIELNQEYIDKTYERLDLLDISTELRQFRLINGDSLSEIKNINDNIDCVITSPPYYTILKNKSKGVRHDKSQSRQGVEYYSEDQKDLGNCESFEQYVKLIVDLFGLCKKTEQKMKLYLVISDFTIDKKETDIHSIFIDELTKNGFTYNGTSYFLQNQKTIYPFGYPYKIVLNHIFQYVIEFEV